tara:strand:+ start:848 stop:1039 length:192 start_codon:yes stop_codon:yes gene_type:complete
MGWSYGVRDKLGEYRIPRRFMVRSELRFIAESQADFELLVRNPRGKKEEEEWEANNGIMDHYR